MQRLRLIINRESARDRFDYVVPPFLAEMAIPIETNASEIEFNQRVKRNLEAQSPAYQRARASVITCCRSARDTSRILWQYVIV